MIDSVQDKNLSDSIIKERYYGSRSKDCLVNIFDAALSSFFGRPRLASPNSLGAPKKLLLADGAHLGDTIIIASILPALRETFPNMQVGILTGSWNSVLLKTNVHFDHVHFLDHWLANRSDRTKLALACGYARQSRHLVADLKKIGYEVAINMRPWFPNFVPILWRAAIPIRVGFKRAGFTPLLTHYVPFENSHQPYRSYHSILLSTLAINPSKLEHLVTPWISVDDNARGGVRALLKLSGSQRFVILHPCAGSSLKNWRYDGWVEIAHALTRRGLTPILTGAGAEQSKATAEISAAVSGSINACDRLSWDQLVAAIEQASLVVCVDTSIAHVGAALGVPCVTLFAGMQDPELWRPTGRRSTWVTHQIHCSPCFNKHGCEHMSCVRKIATSQVEQSIDAVLSRIATEIT